MLVERGQRYFWLEQMLGCWLGEDWGDEFDGVYEAAEHWVTNVTEQELRDLVEDVDYLFANVEDTAVRRRMFSTSYAFAPSDDFDAWLRALRQRTVEQLAGIYNHPLADPLP